MCFEIILIAPGESTTFVADEALTRRRTSPVRQHLGRE